MRCVRTLLTVMVLFVAAGARAQDACETRCNQVAAECLKACAGDTKQASRAESAQKMMGCLKACDAKAVPCRAECRKPK